ncbi:MAG TPA: glycosyltransferase family 4 protein [Candidatus Limnocylindria bacterium]|jgi:glycosyltransferase involved in cell wall biosynthesis|nr:glycosyltransferase family 4 protein [Candidatus Limnocylindria bacterium]HEX3287767.1 glycosyltransferase family 4 protein [Mycobacterium sp.]
MSLTHSAERIVLHDYGGYAFTLQLAGALAERGHEVLYLYASRASKSPARQDAEPAASLMIEPIDIGQPLQRYSWRRRFLQDRRYGRQLALRIISFGPTVVMSANSPLDVQADAQAASRRVNAAFIFLLQDIHSIALHRILARRVKAAAGLLASRFARLEKRLVRSSDAIVAITDDFLPVLAGWRCDPRRVAVIENWAPLEAAVREKQNPWAADHGLTERAVLLYAGTLGLKHDPSLLMALADALPEATVVVVSEGLGADWLRRTRSRPNLMLIPFQQANTMVEVLATADILVALLEPDAGAFSVPSKVYAYMVAGRPILASIPSRNLAARTITRAAAGRVVEPGDRCGFIEAARALLRDPPSRLSAGAAGRAFAERNFQIAAITDRFEIVMREALEGRLPGNRGSAGLGSAGDARSTAAP